MKGQVQLGCNSQINNWKDKRFRAVGIDTGSEEVQRHCRWRRSQLTKTVGPTKSVLKAGESLSLSIESHLDSIFPDMSLPGDDAHKGWGGKMEKRKLVRKGEEKRDLVCYETK
ncbi:hypothetical protein AVEN_113330-1 [Araneus ventricosus]|uniref:Uncharacterized protein n=1 Tax=Araneus ventricosus TaxID=182803 RepID=A0A4Y2H991_ARAVE|nr:hypothetical protein AVEN_113330-1 [Araneus ventricosus]